MEKSNNKNNFPSEMYWKKKGTQKESYKYPFFSVDINSFEHPKTKEEKDFYQIKTHNWVGIFCLTKENKIVVIQQFRPGIEAPTIEVPGGVIDDGEEPLDAAKRELREETGYTSEYFHLLGSIRPNPALMNNSITFYVCLEGEKTEETEFDDNEVLQTVYATIDEFDDWINTSKVDHALIVGGFLLFKNKISSIIK